MIANVKKNGQPIASLDSLIAATAYTQYLTLITHNESDFVACNIALINPWTQ
jgi:predicted nucleic acid-binding protein